MSRFNISSFLSIALLALFCLVSMASAQTAVGTGSASSTANGTYSAPTKTASATGTAATSTSTSSSLVSAANGISGNGNEIFALLLAGVVGSFVFGL